MEQQIGPISMREFIDLADEHLTANPTIIMDLGCNSAKDSLYLAEMYPGAITYAIEGSPANWQNYKLAELIKVRTRLCAIGNYTGKTIYYHINDDGGRSGIYSSHLEEQRFDVRIYTLANFCHAEGIKGIDILKIDVEGATLDVLEGAGYILETIKIMHIETEEQEYFPGQRLASEVREFLTKNGFDCILKRQCYHDVKQFDEVWLNRSLV